MSRLPFALLGLLAAAAAHAAGPPAGGAPPVPVTVAPVERSDLVPEVSLVGTVLPRAESLVAAEVAGVVVQVGARRGERVAAGDVLAVLRDAELEEDLASAAAEVRLAQAELEKARADLRRAEELVTKKVAPVEQLDAARRDVQVWEQRQSKAASSVRVLEDRSLRQTVRAPLAGILVEEHVEIGEWVARGGPVAKLADLSTVRLRVGVPEQYVVEIRGGQVVPVRFDALGEKRFQGPVVAMIPAGDPQSRTFPVEVEIANTDGRIRPGMTGRGSFRVGSPSRELLVPKDALVPRGGRSLVYAVVDGSAVEVPVEVVGYKDSKAAVRGELPAGAPVIVRGNERVRPGQAVRVAE